MLASAPVRIVLALLLLTNVVVLCTPVPVPASTDTTRGGSSYKTQPINIPNSTGSRTRPGNSPSPSPAPTNNQFHNSRDPNPSDDGMFPMDELNKSENDSSALLKDYEAQFNKKRGPRVLKTVGGNPTNSKFPQ